MQVLIAEDDPVARRLVSSLLEKWGYDILVVNDGDAAWEILQQPDSPKLALLDWVMPGLDGLEVCRKVRRGVSENLGYTYLIVVTNKDRKEDFIAGLKAGADDYLTKPFDSNELRIRLCIATRMLKLQEKLLDSRGEMTSRRRQEVEIGTKIQETFMLAQPPSRTGRLRVAAIAEASDEIGGDFYEFISHGEDCVDVIVGDVMGKGVPAALLGAAVKTHFVRAMNELLVVNGTNPLPSPQEVVMAVHKQMTHHMIDMGLFLTVFYARLDMTANRLEFVDCGHTHALYYNAEKAQTSTLAGENLPLGFTASETYSQNSVDVARGDILVFYSDGVTEARNDSKELFGQTRLAEVVKAEAHREPATIIHSLLSEVIKFSGSRKFRDDLTCVAVKIT